MAPGGEREGVGGEGVLCSGRTLIPQCAQAWAVRRWPQSPREGRGWHRLVVVMGVGGRTDIVLNNGKRSGAKSPRPQALTCHPLAVHSGPRDIPSLGLSCLLDKMEIMACMNSFIAHNNPRRQLLFPFYWLGS